MNMWQYVRFHLTNLDCLDNVNLKVCLRLCNGLTWVWIMLIETKIIKQTLHPSSQLMSEVCHPVCFGQSSLLELHHLFINKLDRHQIQQNAYHDYISNSFNYLFELKVWLFLSNNQ